MSAPTAEERDRLRADFVRLCETPSPSREERAVADLVTAELQAVGLEVAEDGSGAATGSDSGNLLARIPGPAGAPTVMLCAHLDTVPLAAPVEVVLGDGRYSNANEGILGADNKAAVAVLLAVARRYAAGGAPVGIELLFTTCEELALLGAKELEHELGSDFGFVFDHASPIGELIVAAPTYYSIVAHFRGTAAHAGLEPEAGRSAIVAAAAAVGRMRLGRLDGQTTANVGTIAGGTASNVVAERCEVVLEARSIDAERLGRVVSEMVDAITEAASEAECDVETDLSELFRGFRLPTTARPVQAAAAALESVGIEPVFRDTGGGSDANVFVAGGLQVLNVANGTHDAHQPSEHVSADALEAMLELVPAILAQAGEAQPS